MRSEWWIGALTFLYVTRNGRCPFLHFCFMEKVVIVRHLPHKWGLSLDDDDGLRKGTLLDELTYAFAMRLTEERMTEYYFGLSM